MTTGSVKVEFTFGTQAGEAVVASIDAWITKDGGNYSGVQSIPVTNNTPAFDTLQFDDLPYGEGYTVVAVAKTAQGQPVQDLWTSAPFTVGNVMQVIVVGGSVTPA